MMPTVATRDAYESRVYQDFLRVRGRVLRVKVVQGYLADDSVTVTLADPVRVRVVGTPPDDLVRWCDGWIDPCWNVEPLEQRPELAGVSSMWVYGTSYRPESAPSHFARLTDDGHERAPHEGHLEPTRLQRLWRWFRRAA